MNNHLGSYFRQQRLRQGITLGDLARRVGYRNVSKGSNKVIRFEREGTVTEDLLVALAEALGIDWLVVVDLMEQDRQACLAEWEKWASEPVPMELVARLMPAVYSRVSLPPEVTTQEQAEVYARKFAQQHGWRCCLVVSRRLSVWIGKHGEIEARTEAKPGQPNVAGMTLRSSKRPFLFGFEDDQQ
jgi:transcriptional regulator with XRE-family HTH domain